MPGSGLALTERDRRLLLDVERMGVLTRQQSIALGFFGSKTRANERLKRLVSAEYLSARPQPSMAGAPRLVYSAGRLSAEPAKHRRWKHASEALLSHQVGLVDMRIAFERAATVQRWLTERDLVGASAELVPDAFVEYQDQGLAFAAFVEYDRGTEPLRRIERKVRAYLDLAFSGRFTRLFHRQFFRVLFICDHPGRVTSLARHMAPITDRIFWVTTLRDLNTRGPLGAIWRRPGTEQIQSLTTR